MHQKREGKRILDFSFLSVILGKYYSSSGPKTENEDHFNLQSEEETTGQILQHEKSAAGVFCKLKTRHGSQASHLQPTKDVLGIVASLGKVVDENLSRLFSKYLGMDTMFAIVCKTYEADDPQRRLDILRPNGKSPPGFLDFAVNMIDVESKNKPISLASVRRITIQLVRL
ncbi:hypothetical protein Pint_22581 [Pistacia integerrima]|uniref:Uncharacterized protein n=1 Tax=Pistacia integerrima TaxID=434235 RepID=A0ACC0YK44_9ROSI|nr:hypothetical protein Pint_22581 [Pistacia integerrima]